MKKKGNTKIFLLLAPGLILIVLFFIIPALVTTIMSFTGMDFRLKWNFIGIANFYNIIKDYLVPRIISNTAIYLIGTLAVFNVGLSLILAIFTTSIVKKAGMFYKAIFLLPRFTPPVVYASIWMLILSPTKNGLFNGIYLFLEYIL